MINTDSLSVNLVPLYRVQGVSGAVTAVSETLVWSSKWLPGHQWSQGFGCWISVGAGCLHPVPMQVGVSQSSTVSVPTGCQRVELEYVD